MKVENFYGKEASEKILDGVYKNAFDFMDDKTKDLDDYIAMTYFDGKISYKEFKKEVYKYANKLKSYGLECGDAISLCLPNVPEMPIYKYAAWLLGIKTNLIDPRFNPNGIMKSVHDSHSKLLITVVDIFSDKISNMVDKLNVENIVLVAPSDYMGNEINSVKSVLAKRLYDYKEFVLYCKDKNYRSDKVVLNRKFMKNIDNSKVKSVYFEGMDATIVFTSGTTGIPKGAVLTHDAYNIKVNQIHLAFPLLETGDSFLGVIPFFSAYGSFAGMHNGFVKGMNFYMVPKSSPKEFPELLCKYKINTAIGVPAYFEDFTKRFETLKEEYEIEDLSYVKNYVSGGDVISKKVIEDFDNLIHSYNAPSNMIVGYGSSETAGPVATTVFDKDYYDPTSTGVFMPGVDYIFLDPETNEIVEDGRAAELCISDPGMMDRYIDNEKATEEITVIHDNKKYFKMGDLFTINDRGQIYFQGRLKRVMMRPDGHTVHSMPIEETALLHKDIKNCCVVGIKKQDGSSGSIPVAFIVLNEGLLPSEEIVLELDKLALEHLSERNRALAYTFIEKMPLTLMGKIDYKELEKYKLEDLNLYVVDDTFMDTYKLIRGKNKK